MTNIDVELKPLLMKEEVLYKSLQRVLNTSIFGVNVRSDVKILKKMVEDVRKEIVDKAIEIIPRFINMADSLGLDRDDINGLTGLAGELVYNKFVSYSESVRYYGLYKVKSKDRSARRLKNYNGKAQRYLIMLTNAILWKNGEKRSPKYKDARRILKILVNLKKQTVFSDGD